MANGWMALAHRPALSVGIRLVRCSKPSEKEGYRARGGEDADLMWAIGERDGAQGCGGRDIGVWVMQSETAGMSGDRRQVG